MRHGKTQCMHVAMYQMMLSDDLARFPCLLDSAAVNAIKWSKPLLNEINIPVFRTNRLILECSQHATLRSNELQGLACTSPRGAPGMDELWHNTTEMRDEHSLHFNWINEVTTRRKVFTLIVPQRRFSWIVDVPHGQSSEFRICSTLIEEEIHWTRSIQKEIRKRSVKEPEFCSPTPRTWDMNDRMKVSQNHIYLARSVK